MMTELPSSDDREGWKRYWTERGWTWRKEPEIALARQEELAQRRARKQGIYPFEGMTLTRADIEWLLVTHEGMILTRADIEWLLVTYGGGQGPVDWNDESQREREGLDLRGAIVEDGTDLSALPLARLRGSPTMQEWNRLTGEQVAYALLRLKRVDLSYAHLEGATLSYAHLEGLTLSHAHLERADLSHAHLEGADLTGAHLEGADLFEVHLEGAYLRDAYLEGAFLGGADLGRADLTRAQLKRAYLADADLEGANLSGADLGRANLIRASLASVDLTEVRLADTTGVGPFLVDVKWGETHLSVEAWSHVQILGEEVYAHESIAGDGGGKTRVMRRKDYQEAHRANHQLAVALQDQGWISVATRFAYRAKCLERNTLWYDLLLVKTMKQRFQIGWSLLFSWVLFLLAGYGYRLLRCLSWYIVIVLLFMLLYWWIDPVQFPWWAALGESVNVFHGRGATPAIAQLVHPVRFTLLTVAEAIIGLVLEVIFVATMIQRLFGK